MTLNELISDLTDKEKNKLKWCVIGLVMFFIIWILLYGDVPMVKL